MSEQALIKEVFYPHPLHRVWTALTDSQALAQWLLPNTFAPQVGHRFTLTDEAQEGWSGIVECEVVAVEFCKRLAYLWRAHPHTPAMLITFTLEEVTGGTCLRLEQHACTKSGWQTELNREALSSLNLTQGGPVPMSRFFRVLINETALIEALYVFVTTSKAGERNAQPVVEELHTFAPEVLDVMENMLIDGVQEKVHIEEYIQAVFGHMGV